MRVRTMATSLVLCSVISLLAGSAQGANRKPTVTAFDVPATSASPVPILAFTATDTDGTIAGYLVTQTSATPSASAPGWSTPAPTSYATASTGTITLYGWAKDNQGAVSAGKSDTVTIPAAPPVDDCIAVVAKSGGDFTDIQQAIDSFGGLGPDKRCLVKVLPGVYAVTAPVQMRQYVDVQGSGQENTEIRGDIPAGEDLFGCEPATLDATVKMAGHSALRDLSVTNKSDFGAVAVVFKDTVDARAERVKAVASGLGGDTGSGQYSYFAFRVEGPLTEVTLNEVYAESVSGTPNTGDSAAIGGFCGPRLEVNRSKAVIRNAWYNIGIAGAGTAGGHNQLTVRDTIIECLGDPVESHGILVESGAWADIHGTTIRVDCALVTDRGCYGVSGNGADSVSVDHSDIALSNCDPNGQLWHMVLRGTGRVASSGLSGTLFSPYGDQPWKITNCWDGNFDPIPNR